MSNVIPIQERNPPALHSIEDIERMAGAIAKSGLFGMKTTEQAMALMFTAQAEGQHPATITQDYDIIQGRAARKTHSVLARFQSSGGTVEWKTLSNDAAIGIFSHPKGGRVEIEWTLEQAKKIGLAGKDNWKNYPRAMLRARCIAEGIRAVYPAAIGGMLIAEEAQDNTKDVTDAGSHSFAEERKPEQPQYPQADFDKNLPAWTKSIKDGKNTADSIIAKVSAKGALTEDMKAALYAVKVPQVIDAEPVTDPDKLAEKLATATALDELHEHADLIKTAPDADRAKLTAIYETRKSELKEAQ